MRKPGERIKHESKTLQLLRDVKDRAEQGDVPWLIKQGKVYTAMEPV